MDFNTQTLPLVPPRQAETSGCLSAHTEGLPRMARQEPLCQAQTEGNRIAIQLHIKGT